MLSLTPFPDGPVRSALEDCCSGIALGPIIADALAMPAHWHYDRAGLREDYGVIREYVEPKSPHPGSILWRSQYTAMNERGDILHDQAVYWGQRGVHYHQCLRAGENTLNLQLAKVLMDSLTACGGYEEEDYDESYIDFMLTPGMHRDTYIEECHRKFFTAYARGTAPLKCGGKDIHIGGLAHVGVLCAYLRGDLAASRDAVRRHVSLTHNSPEVLQAADALVKMLCAVMSEVPLREAILAHGSEWFSQRKALEWSKEADEVVIGRRVSPACYIQEAFPASLYLAWKYAQDFEGGVVANANLGGDNCHRGAVLGALIGGAVGLSQIPPRYVDGLVDATALRERLGAMVLH